MNAITKVLRLTVGVALLCFGDLRIASASDVMALPNCTGNPIVKPTEVVLACADAGFSVSHILWTGWGSPFAAGVGVAAVNECSPSCAVGRFKNYQMVLLASGRQSCPDGQVAYAKVTYSFIGRSAFPPDAPGTTNPVQAFGCRKTP
jgi:hypothetical protein